MGMICASTGCPVVASARATIAYSRALRLAAFSRPRRVDLRGMAISSIETYRQTGKKLRNPLRAAIDGQAKSGHEMRLTTDGAAQSCRTDPEMRRLSP